MNNKGPELFLRPDSVKYIKLHNGQLNDPVEKSQTVESNEPINAV